MPSLYDCFNWPRESGQGDVSAVAFIKCSLFKIDELCISEVLVFELKCERATVCTVM